MAHYKVLKEHIGFFGDYCAVGDTFEKNTVDPIWIERGFIEPYTPEPKRWRAEKRDIYWFVVIDEIMSTLDDYDDVDNRYYKSGNYFKSEATAKLVAKSQKLFFEWLHDNEAVNATEEWLSGLTHNLCIAMDEARKAVLEDDSNE